MQPTASMSLYVPVFPWTSTAFLHCLPSTFHCLFTAFQRYTKIGPPLPTRPPSPPAPVPDIEDAFYPAEERAEAAAAGVPSVLSVDAAGSSCQLRAGGASRTARAEELVFGEWTVHALLKPAAAGDVATAAARPAVVVMERRFGRWSLLVYATVQGGTAWDVRLRKPLGALHLVRNCCRTARRGTVLDRAAVETQQRGIVFIYFCALWSAGSGRTARCTTCCVV